MTPDIEIYIDRLVLHEHSAKSGRIIGQALEKKLQQLIIEGGLPQNASYSLNMNQLTTGDISAGQRPASVGQQIATNIYQQLSTTSGESKNTNS